LLKIFISFLIGAVFSYLTLKNVDLSNLHKVQFKGSKIDLINALLLLLTLPFLRAFRLRTLYRDFGEISLMTFLKFNNVGFLFIVMLPMRLGEFIIPYLIKKNLQVSLTVATGVIILERVIDLAILFAILSVCLISLVMPQWFVKYEYLLFGISVIPLTLLISFVFRFELFKRLIAILLWWAGERVKNRIFGILDKLYQGVSLIRNPRRVIFVVFQSIFIWLVSALIIFFLLRYMSIELSLLGAATVMVVNTVAIALPAGPGMMGSFQYSCMVALSIFSVETSVAFIFANYYYALAIGLTLLIGVVSLPFVNLKYAEIKSDIRQIFKL